MSTPKTLGQIALRNVLLTYVHVDKPWAKQGDPEDKKKYSLTPVIPKNHPQAAALQAAANEVALAKWGDKLNKSVFPTMCVRDTDLPTEAKHRAKDGFGPGKLFLNASRKPSDGPPAVRHASTGAAVQLSPLTNPDVYPYSGATGDVVLKFWAQDNIHGQKVNCELVAVVKTGDGEKLAGGGTDAEAAVGDLLAAPAEEV
jgi:hypothetical protein